MNVLYRLALASVCKNSETSKSNTSLPLRLSFVSSLDRFCRIWVNVILKVSVYHRAVFTIVQFVTLPSPAMENRFRYPSRLSFAHFT